MKTDDLKAKGLTEDQISFVMAENGKDINRLKDENSTLTSDRDSWKEKAEAANETLKKFEGIDPEKISEEVEGWKQKFTELDNQTKEAEAARKYEKALNAALAEIEFSSKAAKANIVDRIMEKKLPLENDKILGLADYVEQLKTEDATAFVTSAEKNKARFTTPKKTGGEVGSITRADFLTMSLDERIKLKESDPELYKSLKQ